MRLRSWHVLAAGLLVCALAVLATLQYRWLGEVSRAERERLQASLRSRATQFTSDFDRDLTRLYACFLLDPLSTRRDGLDVPAALAAAWARGQRESDIGRAIEAVYVAETPAQTRQTDPTPAPETARVHRLDTGSRSLQPVDWPPELEPIRQQLGARAAGVPDLPVPPGLAAEQVSPDVPALVLPIIESDFPTVGDNGTFLSRVPLPGRVRIVIVKLDPTRIGADILPILAARHFGGDDSTEYDLSVVRAAAPDTPIYRSRPDAAIARDEADHASDFFAIRSGELRWTRELPAGGEVGRLPRDRVAITIVRRGPVGEQSGALDHGGDRSSADGTRRSPGWLLLARARGGSLEAVVARSRTRNLLVSLGVAGLLGLSVGLALMASAREQRLARQQLEFVASVSHELRTPLAVIRSAAENLADGVVGADHVPEYGALIRGEGRRLTEMVDRVMDFASAGANAAPLSMQRLRLRALVAQAVADIRSEAESRGVTVHLNDASPDSEVMGDEAALRSVLQNAIGNAVKYSERGGRVEIGLSTQSGRATLSVRDTGIGIDAADVPHVFSPFFRGRRAIASQARGSGLGLTIVQRSVEAHGGSVRIASTPGDGTMLEIALPLAGDGSTGAGAADAGASVRGAAAAQSGEPGESAAS